MAIANENADKEKKSNNATKDNEQSSEPLYLQTTGLLAYLTLLLVSLSIKEQKLKLKLMGLSCFNGKYTTMNALVMLSSCNKLV